MPTQKQQNARGFADEHLREKGADQSAEELLRERGIELTVEEFFEVVVDRLEEQSEIRRRSTEGMPSEATKTRLSEAGLTFEPFDAEGDPMAETVVDYAELVARSLSTKQAAQQLDVQASRIRQMLGGASPKLYGFKTEPAGRWHIPAFQFESDGIVRGIGEVVSRLNTELHPLEVWKWFTTANPDLVDDQGRRRSPLQWLRAGYPVEPVAEIAQRIQ